jgi:hypothetical protein
MPAEKQSGFPSGVLKKKGMDDCFIPAAKAMLDGIREKVYGRVPNPQVHPLKVQSQADTLPRLRILRNGISMKFATRGDLWTGCWGWVNSSRQTARSFHRGAHSILELPAPAEPTWNIAIRR